MKHIIYKLCLGILLMLAVTMVVKSQSKYQSIITELNRLQKELVPDKRVAILDITIADTLKQVLTLKGETDLPEAKLKIITLLKEKGVQFTDSIKVYPAASLGDKVWGLVTLSVINLRSAPDHAAELVSQALMGTPLKVLDQEDGWFRIQTPDLYIGWMEGSGIELFTSAEMLAWKKSDRYVFNKVLGNAFDAPERNAQVVTDLVLGDLFVVEKSMKGFLHIRLPDGRKGYVSKDNCLSWSEWTTRKPDVQAMISIGRQLLGVPYLWGGTSCKSMDCSGFSKTLYFSQGIVLARDASQQARYGQHPDFEKMDNLQAGDLLFFGRNAQRVNHVGIYMGQGRYIHSSGLVRINSIDPKDPLFNLSERKSLVTSSRILNSLNTEGITLVKDHNWYSIVK